jgi:tetratricopeptide (TPR) repeat protein
MKNFCLTLIAASLMVCAATQGRSEALPSSLGMDAPENVKMAEVKGDLARIDKNYTLAISYYLTALHNNPQNAVLYDKIGIAQLQLGDRKLARKYFLMALKRDPHYVAAINNLGVVALFDKKYKTSINYLKQALALDEARASTHVNLAEAWIGMGKTDRAMTEYTRALELDADVLSYSQDGFQAQVSTPQQRAVISFLIARAYAKRGNLDGALDYLRRARDNFFPEMSRVYTDKDFSALWQDPRLEKIVKR